MITIDEKEFDAIMRAHSESAMAMSGDEYVGGYLAAISDALIAVKVSEKKQDTEKLAEIL